MIAELPSPLAWDLLTQAIGSPSSRADFEQRLANSAGVVYCGETKLCPVWMLRDMLLVEGWLNTSQSAIVETPCPHTAMVPGFQT